MKYITRCKKCGKLTPVDTSVVLTSLPPQYRYTCENCGDVNSCFTHEAKLERPPTHAKIWRIKK